MSFMHLRMLNSASKCLKITQSYLKNFKTRKNISKKTQVEGDIPLESFEWGLIPSPPLAETLVDL
jgi:hypothetical protein